MLYFEASLGRSVVPICGQRQGISNRPASAGGTRIKTIQLTQYNLLYFFVYGNGIWFTPIGV
jgi:hypothetical protein